jgi:hypothetical protein
MINTSDFIADLVQAAPTNHLVDNIGIAPTALSSPSGGPF